MQEKIENKKIILEVQNLTCKFNENHENEVVAVDDFSFQFEENKIYFIIGNSGSGKSTLVAHFNGLIKSKKGDIRIDDFHIYGKKRKIKNTKKLRRLISMVFQFPEYQLFKNTIEKDISFGPLTLKIPSKKAQELNKQVVEEIVFKNHLNEIIIFFDVKKDNYTNLQDFISKNKLDLKLQVKSGKNLAKVIVKNESEKKWIKKISYERTSDSQYLQNLCKKYLLRMGLDESFLERSPFGLSGGQKRRVAIAGILAIEPKILIFDEPTAGLDPKGEQEMMKIILDAKENKQTVIVITHTMDHVLEIADHVIVLDQGKILMHGNPYQIFTNKDLYSNSKMEKPKIIDFIDSLCEKDKRFISLYDRKPRTVEQLSKDIEEILSSSKKNQIKKKSK
ncbi:MAG: ATP-binding cassette domain-containing protein [Malacoplasma sp.]|nr:ATP-binding cassette domain-containing protein [Malacoplasma sp.]